MLAIKDKCPGQKECDDAIDTLNDSISTIDQGILEVVSSSLQPSPASSLQVCIYTYTVHVHVYMYNNISDLQHNNN